MKNVRQLPVLFLLSVAMFMACNKHKDPIPSKDAADPQYALVGTTWILNDTLVKDTLHFVDVKTVNQHGLITGVGHYEVKRNYHFDDPNITIEEVIMKVDTILLKRQKYSGTVDGDKMTLKSENGEEGVYHKI